MCNTAAASLVQVQTGWLSHQPPVGSVCLQTSWSGTFLTLCFTCSSFTVPYFIQRLAGMNFAGNSLVERWLIGRSPYYLTVDGPHRNTLLLYFSGMHLVILAIQ